LLPNPLPFETESIDTNIAMVRRVRQKLSNNYCFPPFIDSPIYRWRHIFYFYLVEN